MGIQLSAWLENVGKEQFARCEKFILFQQCFQKQFVADGLKMSIYGIKGYTVINHLHFFPQDYKMNNNGALVTTSVSIE